MRLEVPWAILLRNKAKKCQQNTKPLSTDAEWLTFEAAFDHLELLEVGESAPFRRDSTSEGIVVRLPWFAEVKHLE